MIWQIFHEYGFSSGVKIFVSQMALMVDICCHSIKPSNYSCALVLMDLVVGSVCSIYFALAFLP
jgi:hypothetical protein